MEQILENEIKEFYVTHAIRFPEQLKLTDEKDNAIWCIQREITKVFCACLQIFSVVAKKEEKESENKEFSDVKYVNVHVFLIQRFWSIK